MTSFSLGEIEMEERWGEERGEREKGLINEALLKPSKYTIKWVINNAVISL